MTKDTALIDKIGKFRSQRMKKQFRKVVRNLARHLDLPIEETAQMAKDRLRAISKAK